MLENGPDSRYDDYADGDAVSPINEYDITVAPNDFNVMTLKSLVDNGWVRIPGFQRHYVWDRGRASKLIESLILGLPVPQLFLYEQERNVNLLIDGQQRMMSIYYFLRQRFPRTARRAALRNIFDRRGHIPDDVLNDDDYFRDFDLHLPDGSATRRNRLAGATYETLNDNDRSRLDLRPIRCIIVHQNAPDDGSAIYEIFARLNTGGIHLRPQEIRTSMYRSEFYDMLGRINALDPWREIIGSPEPELHMKDVEILLRGFAMLVDGERYAPSMVRFLNRFSKNARKNSSLQNDYLETLFRSFVDAASHVPPETFMNKANNHFNIALYEAVFAAACRSAYDEKNTSVSPLDATRIEALRTDPEFMDASQKATTQTAKVQARLQRANNILHAAS